MDLDTPENIKRMGKVGWIFCLSILLASCSVRKKSIVDKPIISKTDTTIVSIPADTAVVDSLQVIRQFYNRVFRNKNNFQTFNGKIKAVYKSKDVNEDVTIYVRIAKDSVIWLSVRGLFGLEGARILMTKDSVKFINYLEKTILYKDISYLEQLTALPFDFAAVHNLVVGNPVLIDSNKISIGMEGENKIRIEMDGYIFNHVALIDGWDYSILESDIKEHANYLPRNCRIVYGNYDKTQGVPFSLNRSITVSGQNNLEVNMEYKSYSFNDAVSFPFSIPDNFKKL